LAKGGEVSGLIVDKTNSAPIKGVEICATQSVLRAAEVTPCTDSDANGEFALRNLGANTYTYEFTTAGEVNYVDTSFTPPALGPGAAIGVEARLVRGVEVKGTVTEAGTGLPVEGLGPPFSDPAVCAIEVNTGEDIKCTNPGVGGVYSIPGIAPGRLFTVAFSVDEFEGGIDVDPDGYVRQYLGGADDLESAETVFGSAGSVFEDLDAVLIRGEEIPPASEPPGGQPGGDTVTFTAPHARCVKIKRKHPAHKHHQKKARQ
jgi:hypothetical protein